MKQDILLSVRAEDDQQMAVRYALSLCRDLGARLTVLAVASDERADTYWLCVQERLREETFADMAPALRQSAALAAAGGVECRVESCIGDFYEQVEAYAERHRPHLVIVACPPPRKLSLRWCQEMACELRGRLGCPVVSLVPWGSQA